jgi:hypothetical protein
MINGEIQEEMLERIEDSFQTKNLFFTKHKHVRFSHINVLHA